MAQELPSANGGGDGVSSAGPQESQNMRLLHVDAGDGKTTEIPVNGHLTPPHSCRNCCHFSQAAALEKTGERQQSTAMAEPQDAAGDANKYLHHMRGWLMTVAALFAMMSFQAATQRPSWAAEPRDAWKFLLGRYRDRTSSADPAEADAGRAVTYVLLNTNTLSVSLAVVVLLLLPPTKTPTSPEFTLCMVRTMMVSLCFVVAFNFSFMVSTDSSITYLVLAVMAMYALLTVVCSWMASRFTPRQSPLSFRAQRVM